MKYLNDYMKKQQTAAFEKAGAFFAFSNDQYQEKAKKDVKYVSMGSGLVCERGMVDQLLNELDEIYINAINQDIKENGKKAIIHRELANHECQITQSINACVEKLEDYPITTCEILKEYDSFFQKCIDNDWF